MNEFQTVLNAVLPVFALAGLGVVLRRVNWLTEEADASLLKLTVNVLIPCLIFDSVQHNAALQQLTTVLLAPAVGFGTVALGIGVARLAQGWTRLTDEPARRTFALSTGLYNYGYVPLPLALLLFGNETAGVLLVHNVGVEIALWTLGLAVLSGTSLARGGRQILSPPLVAIVLGLALNFSGHSDAVPGFLLTGIHMLGQCAIPLGLVLIGATIADHFHEFHSAAGGRVIVVACLLRLGLLPLLFLVLARYLPCSVELKRVIVLQAAMPAAVFPIVMVRHYGGDPATALRVVISTSALGLVTIPLWIRWGMKFIVP